MIQRVILARDWNATAGWVVRVLRLGGILNPRSCSLDDGGRR